MSFDDRAHFKCLGGIMPRECERAFVLKPGWRPQEVRCPQCFSLYAKWVDYPRYRTEKRKRDGSTR